VPPFPCNSYLPDPLVPADHSTSCCSTSPLLRASALKEFEIALHPCDARHYSEALERVRGKTPRCQIIPRALVRDYPKTAVSEFRATARDLSSCRPSW